MSELKSLMDMLRDDVRGKLPDLVKGAIATYQHFSEGPAPEDAKAFMAYQAACRAALAHIHLLIKLADFSNVDREGAIDHELNQLIDAARAAVEDNEPESSEHKL